MSIEEEICFIFGTTPMLSILRCKDTLETYTYACVVIYYWHNMSVILKSVQTAPSIKDARLIKKFLKGKGFKLGSWERKVGNPRITKVVAHD